MKKIHAKDKIIHEFSCVCGTNLNDMFFNGVDANNVTCYNCGKNYTQKDDKVMNYEGIECKRCSCVVKEAKRPFTHLGEKSKSFNLCLSCYPEYVKEFSIMVGMLQETASKMKRQRTLMIKDLEKMRVVKEDDKEEAEEEQSREDRGTSSENVD